MGCISQSKAGLVYVYEHTVHIAVFATDDTYTDFGEVVKIDVVADVLLQFLCCYPGIQMM